MLAAWPTQRDLWTKLHEMAEGQKNTATAAEEEEFYSNSLIAGFPPTLKALFSSSLMEQLSEENLPLGAVVLLVCARQERSLCKVLLCTLRMENGDSTREAFIKKYTLQQ